MTLHLFSTRTGRELAEKGLVAGFFYVLALLISTVLVLNGLSAPIVGATCAGAVAVAIPLAMWWRYHLTTRRKPCPSPKQEAIHQANSSVHQAHSAGLGMASSQLVGNEVRAVEPEPLSTDQRLVVVFASMADRNFSRVQLDREIRLVDQAIASASPAYRCEFHLERLTKVSQLEARLLQTRPHVLHFYGHGQRGEEMVRARRRFFAFNPGLRCVVLVPSHSTLEVGAIAEQVDCIIRFSAEANDLEVRSFSAAFYRDLASGGSVWDAFELARANIKGRAGRNFPRLLAPRCDPASIVFVAPPHKHRH